MITEYLQANGQALSTHQVPAAAATKRVRGISMSVRETRDLVAQGLSLKEVAEHRGFSETTIRSHLERYVQEGGQVDLGHLMPPEPKRRKIESAFRELGDARLTPVKELLGNDFTWEELAVVRMDIRQRLS